MKCTAHRYGKHPAKRDYRTLRLKDYLTSKLPAPPKSFDALAQVYAKLSISDPTQLFPIDGNDQYGDCTIAALAHAVTVYNGLVGTRKIPESDSVVKLYFHLTDGVDSGMNALDVLNYWRKHAAEGEKILAFAKVERKNINQVKQAISLFGGVYLGFQVQENADTDFEARKPWTPGDLTNDGHAVYATAYDENYITVLTWGNTQQGTWDWWLECVDEAYAILPPEAKMAGFTPGFDFQQLKEDLADVAHNKD